MPKQGQESCRADTFLGGLWLIVPETLQALVDAAWTVVEKGELEPVRQRSSELNEEQEQKLYSVTPDGIAKVQISGPLTKYPTSFTSMFGGTAMVQLRQAFREIENNSTIRGVFVEADSNGGTAEGTPETASALARLDTVKPVWVHSEDKAASGMLYIGVNGRRFTAGPGAMIGSQGTVLRLMDRSGEYKDRSIKPIIISTGKFKAMGAEGMPISKEHIEEFQRMVNAVNSPFRETVTSRRKLTEEQAEEVATARIFVGVDAKRVGLVDEIMTSREAYDNFKKELDGAVIRGPAIVPLQPAASGAGPDPVRSNNMPLTPEQLRTAREKLPGAAGMSDAGITEQFVLDKAVQLADSNRQFEQTNAALLGRVPKEISADVLSDRLQMATERVDFLVEKGCLLGGQASQLKQMLQVDGKPNAILLTPMANGKTPFIAMVEILQTNKPNGLLKDQTGNQPAPKTEPGSDPKKEDKPTLTRMNQLRAEQGLPPLTSKEYEERVSNNGVSYNPLHSRSEVLKE